MKNLITLLWTVGYFGFAGWKIDQLWRVKIWSIPQMKLLYTKFMDGTWRIDTISEYILCVTLALLIPVWLFGVLILRSMFRKKKAKQVIRQAEAAQKSFVPTAMPSQGKSMTLTPQPDKTTTSPSNSAPIPSNEAHRFEQEICDLADEYDLTTFRKVMLKDVVVPMSISSDIQAILVQPLTEDVMWRVQIQEPLENTTWTAEGKTHTFLNEIVKGRAALSEMEPDAEILMAVVLADGYVENIEQVAAALKQHDINLVVLSTDKQVEGIQTLRELIVEKFQIPEHINTVEEDSSDEATPVQI